ncbi:MAG: hypothetical protein Q7N50_08810, partial [Armatimonadota bacterium]|nr:hypothetical protein [Armatimonadota bacterium]
MAAEIKVVEPSGSGNVYTGLPFFNATTKVIEKSSIKVYIGTNVDLDMDGIPDYGTTPLINSTNIDNYYDDASRQLKFQLVEEDPGNPGQAITYPIQPKNPLIIPQALEAGPHRICIIGDIFGSTTKQVKTIKVFSVVPKIIPAGISLMSVPYALANGDGNPLTEEDPQDLTDDFFKVADYQLARWIPASSGGNYAVLNFPLMVSDSRASLFPPNTAVQQQGAITTTPPAGMGYWLQVGSDTPLLPNAVIDDSSPYDIPVIAGWNMIGDPFPFNVDWNGVLVTYQERTLPISEAVSAGWLRSSLYRYNRVTNAYAVDVLPLGSLAPWQGYWIKALKGTEEDPLKLTILPIPSYPIGGVLTAASPSAAGLSTASMGAKIAGSSKDDWSIKLVATAGTASDAENVAGASSRSVDGYDGADIENPPSLWRFVDLSFPHRNWGGNSGSYTRDIRAPMTFGKTKTWEFEVNTDIAKTDVRLTWPDITSLPKGYSATLEDVDSGKKLSMRTRGAYSYNAGTTPGKRRFKMTVAPSKADRLVISKVSIASIRPTGVKVSYTISHEAKVEVRIYRGGRKPVRILGLDDLSAAGAGSIIWDGKITNGSKARTGLYTFEIIATDADGRIAKVTRMCLFRR